MSWDVSSPTAITSLGENWTIQLQMHDVADPGAGKDTLGITVWDGSGALVFSSAWDTTTTKEQVIGGVTSRSTERSEQCTQKSPGSVPGLFYLSLLRSENTFLLL